jgi:uncharacterized protein YbaA (DUF1428 family)
MSYLEVWVMPVKRDRLADYREAAAAFAEIWKDHGALTVTEAEGNGLTWGDVTSFPRAVVLAEDEVCVIAILRFPDKAARDQAMDAAMNDPRSKGLDQAMIDGKRLIFGGFDPFVDV